MKRCGGKVIASSSSDLKRRAPLYAKSRENRDGGVTTHLCSSFSWSTSPIFWASCCKVFL